MCPVVPLASFLYALCLAQHMGGRGETASEGTDSAPPDGRFDCIQYAYLSWYALHGKGAVDASSLSSSGLEGEGHAERDVASRCGLRLGAVARTVCQCCSTVGTWTTSFVLLRFCVVSYDGRLAQSPFVVVSLTPCCRTTYADR